MTALVCSTLIFHVCASGSSNLSRESAPIPPTCAARWLGFCLLCGSLPSLLPVSHSQLLPPLFLSLPSVLCTGCAFFSSSSLSLPLICWSLNPLWKRKLEERRNNPAFRAHPFHWDQHDTAEQKRWAVERGRWKPPFFFSGRSPVISRQWTHGCTERLALPHSLPCAIICCKRQTPYLSFCLMLCVSPLH